MFETIDIKSNDTESTLLKDNKCGLAAQLQSLILSQRRSLQNLSVLVIVNFLAAGLGFIVALLCAHSLLILLNCLVRGKNS